MAAISPKAKDIAIQLHHKLSKARLPEMIGERLARETDAKRHASLSRVKKFLEQQDMSQWMEKQAPLLRLAREFEEVSGKTPASYHELMFVLGDRLTPDGSRIHFYFNDNARQLEITYESLLSLASKKVSGQAALPDPEMREHRKLAMGDFSGLDAWLKKPESRDRLGWTQKLEYLVETHHGEAAEYLVRNLSRAGSVPQSILQAILNRKAAMFNEIGKTRFVQPSDAAYTLSMETAARLKLSPREVVGIEQIQSFTGHNQPVNFTTYKKIRGFLSYEFADLAELNKASAMMTLLYPDYNNFASAIRKHAAYDKETGNLNLKKLIDDSSFTFRDIDYPAWGEALRNGHANMFFYFKLEHLIGDLPKNAKGQILISEMDRHLYEHIAEVNALISDEDLEKFSTLKIAKDLLKTRSFKRDCIEALNGRTMPDKVTSLPEIKIDGHRFGMPGHVFQRISYHDDRFFLVGRLTGNCEYLGGEWEAPIKEAYKDRQTTYYAVFAPDGKILVHTWTRRNLNPDDIVFDGFEKDNAKVRIGNDVLEKIKHACEEDFPLESFRIGTSQSFAGMKVDIETVRPGQENADHVKKIARDEVWSAQKVIEDSGPAAPIIISPDNLLGRIIKGPKI